MPCCMANTPWKGNSLTRSRWISDRSEGNNIEQADGKKWSEQDRDTFDPTHDIDLYCDQGQRSCEYCHYGRYGLASAEWL
ncbi:phage major head protein [Escherichia coli]|uniref:Phage major head protein n=1 Tax=Escherichia coli TaxID=562 RepID=A0A3S4L421_ECOLX|nr:phage major head protein [Escherichia coli]